MALIFVFGSNTMGRHGKGAALTAKLKYGAVQNIGEGLMGQSYALPTCGVGYSPLPLETIQFYVNRFILFARSRQDLGFKVTRVGCGLAYYRDAQIAPMFQDAPSYNVFFDDKWKPWLGPQLGTEFEFWGTF